MNFDLSGSTCHVSPDVQQALSVGSNESHHSRQRQQQQHQQNSPIEDLPPSFQQQLSPNANQLRQQHLIHQHHPDKPLHHHYHQQQHQHMPQDSPMHQSFTETVDGDGRGMQPNNLDSPNKHTTPNMFGELNFDHSAFSYQPPPPQPRFSFLPPVISMSTDCDSSPLEGEAQPSHRQQVSGLFPSPSPNDTPLSREQIFEQLVGPNVTLNQPGFYPYPGQLESVERAPSSSFLPHLMDNFLLQQQQLQHQQQQQNSLNGNNSWQRHTNNFDTAMYHFMSQNDSPSSGEAHSVASGQYNNDYHQAPFALDGQQQMS